MIAFALFFGLRRGEVLGLRWRSIDFQRKSMVISHTVTKGKDGISYSNSTKTLASHRSYPLTDEQVELLRDLKKQQEAYRDVFGKHYDENDYVFKHIDGRLFYVDYPTKLVSRLIKKFPDLPQGVTFHGLRTSCVSILVREGMDVKSI